MLDFAGRKLIVYELNEVPKRVLDSFIARHPESTLGGLCQCSMFANTHVSDDGILSPWSTWPTLHRGVTNKTHTITDFGQNLTEIDAEYPPIWSLLANSGLKIGVFGSLHTYPLPDKMDNYLFYMPDTFAAGPEAYPELLEKFQSFNLSMVDVSARNVKGGLPLLEASRFLLNSKKLGLRATTGVSIGRQLLSELFDSTRKTRRRTSQMELAFDVYEKKLWDTKPDYSCFFTNHVASSMHRYWPGAFPDDYTNKELPIGWHDKYSDEIDYTMLIADQQIKRLRKFVDRNPGYSLLLLSSMGQEAVDNDSVVRSQLYATDLEQFLRALGVDASFWARKRAMLPRYIIEVAEGKLVVVRDALGRLRIQGQPVQWKEHERGVFMIKLGHVNVSADELVVELNGRTIDHRQIGLEVVEIDDATGSYAYHMPKGIMIHYDPSNPKQTNVDMTVDTTEIAPSIMRNFGLEPMSYMKL